jgi:C-terminal processing protease CtpA/Prc
LQGMYGDYIVFQRGTDLRIDVRTLRERYALKIVRYLKWEAGLRGTIVAPALTAAQVAELRCDPVVEELSLQHDQPVEHSSELPYGNVRFGIGIDSVGEVKVKGRVPRGVAVTSVGDPTVASRAGLQEKDLIVKFDGQDINSMDDLSILVMEKKPGDAVPLVVSRNGREITLIAQF